MKLPSIKYNQRAPLARLDPAQYLRIGEANASAIKSVTSAVAEVVQKDYEQSSVAEMQSNSLNYNEVMNNYELELRPSTENEDTGEQEGSWVNGQKNFKKFERELRQGLLDKMTSSLAKRLFTEQADKRITGRIKTNSAQLLGFQKDNNVATLQTTANRLVDEKDFKGAALAYAQAATVGTITDAQAQVQIERLNNEAVYFDFSVQAGEVAGAADLINLAKKANESSMSDPDKAKTIAAGETVILNKNRKDMDDVIQAVANDTNGTPLKAYAAGQAALDRLKRKSAEQLGGDEDFKQDVYFAAKQVLARYYEGVVKGSQVLSDRKAKMRNYMEGRTVATSKFNITALSDSFLVNSFNYTEKGSGDYALNFNNEDVSLNAVSDEDFLTNKLGKGDLYVSFVERTGNQVPLLENKLNAALTSNNGELANGAAAIAYKIGQSKRSALYAAGKKNNMSIINTQMELMGKGFDGIDDALKTLKQYNAVSPEERIIRIGGAADNNKFFEDNFDNIIEKVYPDPTSSWYSMDSFPAAKRKYMNSVKRSMETQLVINNGDQAKALQAAIITSKEKWSPSNINGTNELMEFAPEDVIPDTVPDNTDSWRRDQIISELKAAGSTLNIDYDTLKLEAVQRFDKNKPAWTARAEVDGMVINLGLVTLDESKSPKAIEQKQEIANQKAANLRTEDRNKKRIQWNKESTPADRAAAAMRGMVGNPYGEDPSKQGAIGKAISGYGKGSKAMGQAAKEGQGIIKASKAKRLAAKAAKAKLQFEKNRSQSGRGG